MARFLRKHSLSTVASVALHAAVVAALVIGVRFSPSPLAARGAVTPIEAVLVDEAAVQQEIDRIEARQQAEIERQREAEELVRQQAEAARVERQREEERLAAVEREREQAEAREADRQDTLRAQRAQEETERQAREEAAEAERARIADLQRQRQEEERRQAEAERQRQEEDRRRAEAAERQRLEEEARLAAERAAAEERRRQEAAEAARLQAEVDRVVAAELAAAKARESGLYDEYIRNITNQIRQRWIRPPGSPPNLECIVNVTQIPSGDVTSVTIGRCNGDEAVVRSIEAAVRKASPLPRPGDPSLFQRNLVVTFRPEN